MNLTLIDAAGAVTHTVCTNHSILEAQVYIDSNQTPICHNKQQLSSDEAHNLFTKNEQSLSLTHVLISPRQIMALGLTTRGRDEASSLNALG